MLVEDLERPLETDDLVTLRDPSEAALLHVLRERYAKDRIFTNLYNDTSPWLEDAKKRVRRRAIVHRACAALHRPPALVDSGLR